MINTKLRNLRLVLKYRGVFYPVYFITGYLFPLAINKILYNYPAWKIRRFVKTALLILILFGMLFIIILSDFITSLITTISIGLVTALSINLYRFINLKNRLNNTRKHFQAIRLFLTYENFTKLSDLPINKETFDAILKEKLSHPGKEIVIGKIDHDLRVLGLFGEINTLPPVSEQEFSSRPRFTLDIVLKDDVVLVRKDFRGDKDSFLNEWQNTILLYGKANVANIYAVDEKNTVLYKNLIVGEIIRDKLMAAGARIMSVQINNDHDTKHLSKAEKLTLMQKRGRDLIQSCVSEDFLKEMEDQIDKMHAAGITGVVPTFGNVIDENRSRKPYFIDFEGTVYNPKRNIVLYYRRNQDRKKLNESFQRDVLTEEHARRLLAEKYKSVKNWYAPIDFGNGLAISGFWSIGSGTGRWEIIRNLITPLTNGKRILDLGSNNGIMPLLMIRDGAKSVFGVELSKEYFDSALLIKEIFEWREIRKFDFHLHQGNMLEILDADWGQFDVVTSFCSLYYLSEKDMAQVVKRASQIAPTMILQANTATRAEAAEEKSKKSSIEFMEKLLRENGFPIVEVHTLRGYTRPLLIGKKQALTQS